MFSLSANQRQRFQIIILIFLLLLLSVALIVTWNTPAKGYEASIYRSTPLILWVSLLASVIAGVTMVVVSIAKDELEQNSLWKIGFLLIVLSYTICLSLFIIRGYYMWCMTGDPATHIGWITETISQAYAPKTVIYPITHIFLSEISIVTDLDLVTLHKIIPILFSVLFIIFMYIFAKIVFSNTIAAVLVALISCSISRTDFYLNLIPNGLSSLLLPLALFVMFQYAHHRRWVWAVPLFILIILYPVFHPVPTIFIGLVFLTLWIPHIVPDIKRCIQEKKLTIPNLKSHTFVLILPFLVMLIWFIFWIASFRIWDHTLRSVYQTLFLEGTESEAMDLLDTISYAQIYGYNVIEVIVKQYGVVMVLFALSVLGILLILRNQDYRRYNESLLSLLGPFGVLSIVIPILFLFALPFNAFRFLHAFLILTSIFSAYTLYYMLIPKGKKALLQKNVYTSMFVIVVIFSLFIGGMLNLYPSPYNLGTSYHNTRSEVEGMEYVYDHRDVNTPISGISVAPGRFADALLSFKERSIQHLPNYLKDEDRVPWHFGYDMGSSISSNYSRETDLVILPRDKVLYVDIFPEMAQHRFTNQDFERLNIDPGIDFIYSNGEFDFFKITMMH